MCGATDNRAALWSSTLTLLPLRGGNRTDDFLRESFVHISRPRLSARRRGCRAFAFRSESARRRRRPGSRASVARRARGFHARGCARGLCAALPGFRQNRLSRPFELHTLGNPIIAYRARGWKPSAQLAARAALFGERAMATLGDPSHLPS